MSDSVFVDTNVLVYSRDASEPDKQKRAMAWMTRLWQDQNGRLSYQVLQEYYITVTQKLKPGLTADIARTDVRSLITWNPLPVDTTVIEGAWAIQDRYAISWWDALIVSAAQASDCIYLLTEDLQPEQTIGAVTVVSPFATAPEHLPR
ncbi:MAG: PIN domain-containing protein [Pseudomonadota bacterium]